METQVCHASRLRSKCKDNQSQTANQTVPNKVIAFLPPVLHKYLFPSSSNGALLTTYGLALPYYKFNVSVLSHREGNGTPLQYSCLENPRDGGAWWAAIYGVTQSWTRLKPLSSSSFTLTIANHIPHPGRG